MMSGLVVGSIYAIIALSIVVVYKSTQVFNFAIGELLLLGAAFCYMFSAQLHMPTAIAVIGSIACAIVLAMLIQRFGLRPLIGQPILASLMATLAIGSILAAIYVAFFGGPILPLQFIVPTGSMTLGSMIVSKQLMWSFVACIITLGIFTLFFKYTKFGLLMRATAENSQVARAMGINAEQTFMLAWLIACLLALVGGLILGNINGIGPHLSGIGIIAIPAVLLGGLDSVPGAVIGGLVLGVLQSTATGYLSPLVGVEMGEVFPFFILILILIIRPYGLFGLQRIERI